MSLSGRNATKPSRLSGGTGARSTPGRVRYLKPTIRRDWRARQRLKAPPTGSFAPGPEHTRPAGASRRLSLPTSGRAFVLGRPPC